MHRRIGSPQAAASLENTLGCILATRTLNYEVRADARAPEREADPLRAGECYARHIGRVNQNSPVRNLSIGPLPENPPYVTEGGDISGRDLCRHPSNKAGP